MLSFEQEQTHFLNIAVARLAQEQVLTKTVRGADPATVLHVAAIDAICRHRDCAHALLMTAGPESDPPTLLDFLQNPRLPSLIDGFISRNTCVAAQRAGAPRTDTSLIDRLSLLRLCLAPEAAKAAGTLDSLPRLLRTRRDLLQTLHPHRAQINMHYQQVLAAGINSQEAVIVAYQPLIDRIAGHERQFGDMLLDDRQQEARYALLRAMDKFDHRRQNRFGSLASYYIYAYVGRASLKQGYAIYEPEGSQQNRHRGRKGETGPPTTISLEGSLNSPDRDPSSKLLASLADTDPNSNPELQAELNDVKHQVRRVMAASLTDTQRTILAMRFGIDHPRPYNQYEVARAFGIRDSTVHRIETEAFKQFSAAAQIALQDYIA